MRNFQYRAHVAHGLTFIPLKRPDHEKHTWKNWRLVPTSRPVFLPPPCKTNKIDITGADGVLDLSERPTGDVKYNNRVGSMEFQVENRDDWTAVYSEIMNYLHGQEMKAILDDDPGYYYIGRFSVNEWRSEEYRSKIVIDYDVQPYKLELTSSMEPWLWDPFNFDRGVIREYEDFLVRGTLEVTVIGSRKPVVPVFVVTLTDGQDMTVTYNGKEYLLFNGGAETTKKTQIPDIVIREGEYKLTFKGNGFVSIDYRGGSL
ncbi:MAG: mtfA protein [Clostridia bacterium]|nr:mtfA protein [Clostridia bacterium]